MHTSIAAQTITFHKTEAAALALATTNQAADPDTYYRVEHGDRGFFVALYEGAERLGTL